MSKEGTIEKADSTHGNLPMLDPSLLATLVLGPVRDITQGVNVLLAFHL